MSDQKESVAVGPQKESGPTGGILFSNLEKPRSTSGWVVFQGLRFSFVDFWLFSRVNTHRKSSLAGTFARWYSGHHQHFDGSGPGPIPSDCAVSGSSILSQNESNVGLETMIMPMTVGRSAN